MTPNWFNELLSFEDKSSGRVSIVVTKKCNLRCAHCNVSEWLTARLEDNWCGASRISSFIDRWMSETRKKTISVHVIGGEALTASDRLREIVDVLSPKHKISLTTNLVHLPEDHEFLRPVNISVSIDGLPSDHDKLRGPGNFKKTYKNLRTLTDGGFNVSVQACVPQDYFEHDRRRAIEFIAYMQYVGVKESHVSLGTESSRDIVTDSTNIDTLHKNAPYSRPCCGYRYMTNFIVSPEGELWNGYYHLWRPEFKIATIDDSIDKIREGYKRVIMNSHFAKDPKCLSCEALTGCWGLYCFNNFKYTHPETKPSDVCNQDLIIERYRNRKKKDS